MPIAIPGRVISLSEAAVNGKLNAAATVGDVFQGGSASASSARLRAGQLGFEEELDERTANLYSDPSVATLHAGWIQYVKLASNSPVPTLGGPLYVATAASFSDGTYIVTADPTTTGWVAGVSILSAWAAGNFWWMYTGGVVGCRSIAGSFSGLAAAVGDQMQTTTDGGSPARGRMDTMIISSVTTLANSVRDLIGQAIVLPVVDTVTLINCLCRYKNRLT